MAERSPTAYDNTAPVFLGIAGLVLAAGGIGATALLWNRTPVEARLAMVILDVALLLFAVTAIAYTLRGLVRQRRRRHSANASAEHRDQQLKLARRLATELNATLVRQRDGTCYLQVGPVEGVPVVDPGATFREYDLTAGEELQDNWLSLMAESLDAELVYDGKSMTWYLRWSNVRETDEGGNGP
jgi:hypothetical protein